MEPRLIGLSGQTVVIRPATTAELLALRHRILREGLPIEEAHFEGDDLPTTRHAGAFIDSTVVCCATFMLQPWEAEPAWRLRGMATEPTMRRSGVGRAVLEFLTDWVLTEPPPEARVNGNPVRLFWCNARTPALEFYHKQGWEVVSEEFFIPTAGPHRNMLRRV